MARGKQKKIGGYDGLLSAIKEKVGALFVISLFSFLVFSCASSDSLKGTLAYTVYTANQREDSYEIRVEYPAFSHYPELNAHIRRLVQADCDKFMKDFRENEGAKHALYTSLTSYVTRTSPYISVALSIYTFSGGANGTNYVLCVNYDTKKNRPVSLESIMNMDKVCVECADFFKKSVKEMKAVFADESNFSFVITGEEVKIFFKQGLFTPHSDGVQSIVLPL